MASTILVLLPMTLLMTFCLAAPNGDKYGLKVPEECKQKEGLCHIKPEGYDAMEEKINRLLPPNLKQSFRDRDGTMEFRESPIEDEDNCRYTAETKPMYLYVKNNGSSHDIIVQTELLTQMVEQVTCVNGGSKSSSQFETKDQQCFKNLSLGSHTATICHQAYTYIDWVVYKPKEDKLVMYPYPVKTCCSCRLVNPVTD